MPPQLEPTSVPSGRSQVFLSYGHDPDCTELARRLRDKLEPEFRVWMDESPRDGLGIRFGDDWRNEILKGIKESDCMLALLSAHSSRKPGVCREEVALALGPLKSYVYTVLVQPVSDVRPPLILSQRQWLDMQEWRQKLSGPDFDAWFEEKVTQILDALRRKSGFTGEMAELQRTLNPLSQVSNMRAAEQGFVGRQWLLGRLGEGRPPAGRAQEPGEEPLGEIERWAIEEPHKRVFWLCADPGWGKSAVMGRLAHAQRARVLAVHFCRHDEEDSRQPHRVIPSLAYQMASQLDDYRGQLLEIVRLRNDWTTASAGDLFRQLIEEPLAHCIEGGRADAEETDGHPKGQYQRRLIVIDALDECLDASERSEFLDVLSERIRTLPEWLGLVISSRKEHAVVSRFRDFGIFEPSAFEESNLADLKLYARDWLQRLSDSGSLPGADLERAFASVSTASGGSFLYLKQLERAVEEGVIQARDLLSTDLLPPSLGKMYRRWFEKKFAFCEAYESEARPLLELMVAAREPIPVSLVEIVLNWEKRKRKRTEEKLGSLIRNEGGRLHFFHKSLADWLLDEDAAGSDWMVEEKDGHCKFAGELLKTWKSWQLPATPIPGAQTPGAFGDWSEDASEYALRHLPHHLLQAGQRDSHAAQLTDFTFAIKRCHPRVIEWFLADYRNAQSERFTPALQCWAETISKHDGEFRGSCEEWPPSRVLLQLAQRHGDDSPLTQAAQEWMDQGRCNWPWMARTSRPVDFRSQQKTWIEREIPLGGEGRLELVYVAVCWNNPPLVAWAQRNAKTEEYQIKVYCISTGSPVWHTSLMAAKICRIAIKSGERRIVVEMDSGTILEAALSEGGPLREVASPGDPGIVQRENSAVHQSWPEGLVPFRWAQAAAERSWFGASKDGSIWRWFGHEDKAPRQLSGPGPKVYHVAVTHDGELAASVGEGRAVSFWNRERCVTRLAGHAHRATHVNLSPDGSRALTAGQDQRILVWNVQEAVRTSTPDFRAEVTVVENFTENIAGDRHRRLVSGDLDGWIRIFTPPKMNGCGKLKAHAGRVWDLAVCPSGSHLISAGADSTDGGGSKAGSIAIWELATQRCLVRHVTPKETLAVAVSPSGKHIVAATADKQLHVWDMDAVLRESSFEKSLCSEVDLAAKVRSLAFSGNDQLFGADAEGVIRTWVIEIDGKVAEGDPMDHGLESQKVVSKREGSEQKGAYALAISPCHGYLACSGRGMHRAISVWKIGASPSLVNVLHSPLRGSLRGTHSLGFVRDTPHLWSANWDGSIVRWDWITPGGRRVHYQPEPQLSVMTSSDSGDELVLGTALGEVYGLRLMDDQNMLGEHRP